MSNRSGLFITQNSITPYLAVAQIQAKQEWEDTIVEVAAEMLEWAKENAPWADRTGDARAGLDVDVTDTAREIVVSLFHTVDYGKWLELIKNGEYAIIMPALEKFGEEIKKRIEG